MMDALGVDSASEIKPQEQYAPETFRIPGSLSSDGTRGPEQAADFGRLFFAHGSRHERPFLHLMPETDMERVVGFLLEEWRISRPTGPILTVTGSPLDFELSEEVMASLRALPDACSATGAWVFTSGNDTGVANIVGQVFRGARSTVPVIGVFPWGRCNGREALDGQRGGTVFYNGELPTDDDGAPLNGDHTHFLLVDDGTEGSSAWKSELQFRAALEKELAALDLSSTLVLLVLQGDETVLETVLEKVQAGLPVIVLTDTGGAAQALGEFLAGGMNKVTEERFKKLSDKLEAIKAADDQGLVYMFSSKSKDGLVQTMRRALGNSTRVTRDARLRAPEATAGQRRGSLHTEKNDVGLELLSAVDWKLTEDVKRVMKQCSKEWVLDAFHLARKKDYFYLALLLAAELQEINEAEFKLAEKQGNPTRLEVFQPKPGQKLGKHGSDGFIARGTDLSGLKLSSMRMSHCKFNRIKTGTDASGEKSSGTRFTRCDLRRALFRLCDLTDANFKDAQLEGASFPQCFNLDTANFEGASWSSYRPPAKRASAEASRSWQCRCRSWRWRAVGKAIASELVALLQGGDDDDDEGDDDDDDHGDDDDHDGGGGGEGSERAQWGKAVDEMLARKLGSLVAAVARFVPAMEAVRDSLKKIVLEHVARMKEPTQCALLSQTERAALRGDCTAAECQSLLKAVIEPVLKRAVDELLKEVLEHKLPSLLSLLKEVLERKLPSLQELIKVVGLPDAPALPLPHADADAAGDGGGGDAEVGGGGSVQSDAAGDGGGGDAEVGGGGSVQSDAAGDGGGGDAEVGGGGSAGEREIVKQMKEGEHDTSRVRELLQALVADIGTEALRAAIAAKMSELVSSAAELVASMAEPALRQRRLQTAGSEQRAKVAPRDKDAEDEESGLLLDDSTEIVEQAVERLNALGGQLADALETGWDKMLRSVLMQRAGHAATSATKAGRSIRKLTSRLEAYEARVEKAVTDAGAKWKKHVPKGGLRGLLVTQTLTAASKYESGLTGGIRGMLRQAFARSRIELTRDLNELVYLLDRLQKLEEKEASELNWRDTAESWQAIIRLRARLRSERGLAVLECIINDPKVLKALGMAEQLHGISGKPPDHMLIALNDGPGSHIRQHAFQYRYMLEREIACVRRVREVQLRALALVGSTILASLVGIANFLARMAYAVMQCGAYVCVD